MYLNFVSFMNLNKYTNYLKNMFKRLFYLCLCVAE